MEYDEKQVKVGELYEYNWIGTIRVGRVEEVEGNNVVLESVGSGMNLCVRGKKSDLLRKVGSKEIG